LNMSMCFSANIMEYENKTIVFGNFNDTKWEIEPDIKKSVNIQRILVKFISGETVEESVGKGYIIFLLSIRKHYLTLKLLNFMTTMVWYRAI